MKGEKRNAVNGQFETYGIENVKAWVRRSNPKVEYIDGFVNFDSHVNVRCTVCNTIFTRSMSTIRHNSIRCPHCYKPKGVGHHKLSDEERLKRKEKRHAISMINKEKRRLQLMEETRKRQEECRHDCPVCGTPTTRRKYCSEKCCRKVWKGSPTPEAIRRHNSVHEAKRRALIKEQIVDKDITLKELFKRDDGICWICGMACDWSDYTEKDGNFIAGNLYPSIDHVIELSNGGAHSWDNVKLAHRICNVKRYHSPISRAI